MKKLLIGLLMLAALVAAGLFWLSRNLDGLVKQAIENYGSPMTQAKVSVGAVNLSPTDGKGRITRLTIGNPPGFRTAHALKVEQVELEVDPASVTQDVVLVRRIAIQAPDVIYEKGDGTTNFDALAQHIARSVGSGKGDGKAGKKLIVDLLTITQAKAQASAAFMNGKTVVVALPDITLRNIGRAKGGVTPAELGQEVANALKGRLVTAANFERLMKSSTEALGQVESVVKGLFK